MWWFNACPSSIIGWHLIHHPERTTMRFSVLFQKLPRNPVVLINPNLPPGVCHVLVSLCSITSAPSQNSSSCGNNCPWRLLEFKKGLSKRMNKHLESHSNSSKFGSRTEEVYEFRTRANKSGKALWALETKIVPVIWVLFSHNITMHVAVWGTVHPAHNPFRTQ